MTSDRRYTNADLLADVLVNEGFTHCFFVAGGNIMHLLDSCRTRFTCIPTVHEVAAGIAAEYFNQASDSSRAFALVTAGPGLTNIVTAIAGAWLEHRELLVIGGQVKSSDLMSSGMRQRGIQEIDGVSIVAPITKASVRLDQPTTASQIHALIDQGRSGRPGPVFLEVCLDVQGSPVERVGQVNVPETERPDVTNMELVVPAPNAARLNAGQTQDLLLNELAKSDRPVLILGAGVSRQEARNLRSTLERLEFPIMTTWHGADRYSHEAPNYVGRPETWGQRAPNLIVNQADLVIAIGARLGLQETGFNYQQFASKARIIQVDIDKPELEKGHPSLAFGVRADANIVLRNLVNEALPSYPEWLLYAKTLYDSIPLNDPSNFTPDGFISPFDFYTDLGSRADDCDIIVPSSSGGANSVAIQALANRKGQTVICNNGLASMGYGLSGAIGAALARPDSTVWLIEGDGGFSQNLQELAIVRAQDLNIKTFIFSNSGYGSIRTTQKNYFGGAYVGCDEETGLGFPNWGSIAESYRIPYFAASDRETLLRQYPDIRLGGPALIQIAISPDQTYWPKIASKVTSSGSMVSAALYEMDPKLSDEQLLNFGQFL